jgi:hypothetical protein
MIEKYKFRAQFECRLRSIFQFTNYLKISVIFDLRGECLQTLEAEFHFLRVRSIKYLLYMKAKGNYKDSEVSFKFKWEHNWRYLT